MQRRPNPRGAGAGKVAEVVKTHRDGRKETLAHSTDSYEGPSAQFVIGKNLGLTLPGPSGSYAAGRIDVWVSMPYDGTTQGAHETSEQIDEVLNDLLVKASKEIREFLETL